MRATIKSRIKKAAKVAIAPLLVAGAIATYSAIPKVSPVPEPTYTKTEQKEVDPPKFTIVSLTPNRDPQPLPYSGSREFIVGNLDNLKRPTGAHIQMSNEDKPTEKREPLTVKPVGWSTGKVNGKYAYNRCHLVGYQFSGVNNVTYNLITGTEYLNTGDSDKNENGMLYYEMRLAKWLSTSGDRLDYQVTPLYDGNNLIASKVRLSYVGYKKDGQLETISLGSSKEHTENNMTVVELDNNSPNFNINYETGAVNAK